MFRNRRLLVVVLCVALLCCVGKAQLAEVIMTPEEAQVAALEAYYDFNAEIQVPRSLQGNRVLFGLVKRFHKARAAKKHTTGEPLLIQELRPNDDFFESQELHNMCLKSHRHVGFQSELYILFIDDNTRTRPESFIEEGMIACKNSLKGNDVYVVPIYDLDGNYILTASFDVNLNSLNLDYKSSNYIHVDVVEQRRVGILSSTEAQELVGLSSSAHLVSFNIPTYFQNDDDYLEGRVSVWLIENFAVHPTTREVFQVLSLDGKPVNLIAGDVEPYLELKNSLDMLGQDLHPEMLYPVKLQPVEISR